jgi:O-antigen ligase
MLCLLAYLLLAGASIGWAYSQEYALQRFVKELLILAPLILPFSQFEPRTEIFSKIFECYTLSILLNMVFVLNQSPMLVGSNEASGSLAYPGYFAFKGYLGECASIAIMMAVFELLLGRRRILSLMVIPISIWLLIASKSKGSLAITILAMAMSSGALLIHKLVKKSLALIIGVVPLAYFVWSLLTENLINKLSYSIYGNPTLTGRTLIWDFVNYEISRHPAFGWGFQSFWLVGPQAPSVVDAPGWIKDMPYTHNGYLDTELQTGYVGLLILFTFLFATIHSIGRVRERSPRRAWLLLSIALYIMLTNFLEAVWFEPDPLWVLFVLVMAESCHYNQNSRVKRLPARTKRVQLSFVSHS